MTPGDAHDEAGPVVHSARTGVPIALLSRIGLVAPRPLSVARRSGAARTAAHARSLYYDGALHFVHHVVATVKVVRARALEGRTVVGAGREVAGVPAAVDGSDRVAMPAEVHPADGRPRLDGDRLRVVVAVEGTDADGQCGPL